MSKFKRKKPGTVNRTFQADGDLPDEMTVNKRTEEITDSGSKSYTLADTDSKSKTYPKHLTNKGRRPFTTMMRPDLKQVLRKIADDNRISVADVLETMIIEYLEIDPESLK